MEHQQNCLSKDWNYYSYLFFLNDCLSNFKCNWENFRRILKIQVLLLINDGLGYQKLCTVPQEKHQQICLCIKPLPIVLTVFTENVTRKVWFKVCSDLIENLLAWLNLLVCSLLCQKGQLFKKEDSFQLI